MNAEKRPPQPGFAACLQESCEQDAVLEGMRFEKESACIRQERADLKGCGFYGMRLAGSAFPRSFFVDAVFSHCDLSNVDFSGSLFRRAIFTDCRMEGADFSECVIEQVQMQECSLRFCSFQQTVWKQTECKTCGFAESLFQQNRMKK